MHKLNPSLKHHALIGALTTIWGFLFGFFIRPFEHGTMDELVWIKVSLGFSLTVFISYFIVALLQKIVFEKLSKWTILLEISTYVLFYIMYSVGTYFYYKGSIIRGFYDFPEFLVKIILNIFLILTPILFLARRYVIKLIPKKEEVITFKGENKLDFLKIKKDELICVSNSQNYVEIFYLEGDALKTKLIRTTLKKMMLDFPFLLQVHRSHLINPFHFKSWKDSSTIQLTKKELPISKSYKNQLSEL